MARKRSRYPGLYKPDNSPFWQYRFMVNGKRLSVSTAETAVEAAWQTAQTVRAEAKSAAKDRYAAHRKRPLSQHIGDWARSLGATGIGDDAEGAKFVAPFLDRKKGSRAAAPPSVRQSVKLFRGRKFRIHKSLTAAALQRFGGLCYEGRQPVIGLWADDDIDRGRAVQYLFALGLGDASGHHD